MKVEIIIDENLDESLVKIYAPSYNEDIENIKRSLEATSVDMVVAFKDDEIYLLEYEEIIRCILRIKMYLSKVKMGNIRQEWDYTNFMKG